MIQAFVVTTLSVFAVYICFCQLVFFSCNALRCFLKHVNSKTFPHTSFLSPSLWFHTFAKEKLFVLLRKPTFSIIQYFSFFMLRMQMFKKALVHKFWDFNPPLSRKEAREKNFVSVQLIIFIIKFCDPWNIHQNKNFSEGHLKIESRGNLSSLEDFSLGHKYFREFDQRF